MNTTVIYCRKSRGTQEELQNQIDLCLSYCNKNNYEVAEIFSEIRSSQDFSREYYCKMMEYIEAHGDVRVICTDLSRLNRNVVAQIKLNDLLIKHGSFIETVNNGIIKTDSPENKMMNNIIANFDEYYFALTKQKMQRGLLEARKKGIKIGAKLYGYEIENKRLVIDPTKADIVKRVFKLIADGYSTKQVVEELKKDDIRTNTNRYFDTRAVRLMVQNEGYTGQKGDNIYPPIVSRELYLEANKQLKSVPNCGNKRSYALSGKIICSKCETSLIIGYKNDRGGAVINSCNSSNSIRGIKSKCNCMGSRLDIVENLVISDCKAWLEVKLSELYHQLKDDKTILAEHQKELDAVQTEINANKEKLSKLNKLFLLDNISEQELQDYSKECKENIALLSEKQKRLEGYSLYRVVQELQDKIVKLEELKESNDMNSLVKIVDYVLYFKDAGVLTVETKFKE